MAAKLPPEDFLVAALNSITNFQKEYWLYTDPKKALTYWTSYRDKVEEILQEITDPVARAKALERIRVADEFILAKGYLNFRLPDFALLERNHIPKERWWYWLDEVKGGKLSAIPGALKK